MRSGVASGGWRSLVAISWQLLLHGILQDEGVGDDLVAGFHARDYFLRVVGEHFSGDDGDALEFIAARGDIDPITTVQGEDCRSWDGGPGAGIVDPDPNFRGADIGIEYCTDIANAPGDDLIGIGIEADVGGVSQA